MEKKTSLLDWCHALTGTTLHTVGSGVRIQISGRCYLPDRVERSDVSSDRRTEATCHFSEAGISLRLVIEATENRLDFSGTLHNHADKSVKIEQLWFGETIIDLGGSAENYRVYYNSGGQESSGTCVFSAIKRATGTAKANLDPDDPDAPPSGDL